MKKLSIIIPVYHNESSLALLNSKLVNVEESLHQKNITLEIIFVDDGSQDNSFAELLKIKQQNNKIKIIKLTRNFGAIQAVKTGLNYVTGDCFVILTADLQDPPELILNMVDAWLAGAKYVICERSNRSDSFLNQFCSAIYYKLLKLLVAKNYPQGGFDLILMDKAILPYIQKSAKNSNVLLYAHWLGYEPTIIHYERQKRIHGKSMWTMGKKIKYFIDSILGFSHLPIRMISMIGFLVALFSFGYGVIVIISAITGNIKVSSFAALAALISFLLGLIIIMLGIIGEYIWRIFDENNNRPEAVVEEII